MRTRMVIATAAMAELPTCSLVKCSSVRMTGISGAMPNHPKKHRKKASQRQVEGSHGNGMEIEQPDSCRFVPNVHRFLPGTGPEGRLQPKKGRSYRVSNTRPFSSTRTGKVFIPQSPNKASPDDRSNFQACKGQMRVVPPTKPSASGPRRWGH